MSSLSQEEIDALINQLSGEGAPAKEAIDGRRVKSFDFRFNKRLDKFTNNQLQTLRTLHENFTRLLNNSLSVYLRTRVEATIVSIEQISYGDFIASIGIPSILGIFSMDPLPGSGIVQVDLNLVFSIIDRLLGGPGWFPNKLRDLTDIERTLMQRFMARMLNSYRESWNYLLTLSLKIEALDSNPQFIPRIIPLDQIVAYISMELKIGDMAGVMNFCLAVPRAAVDRAAVDRIPVVADGHRGPRHDRGRHRAADPKRRARGGRGRGRAGADDGLVARPGGAAGRGHRRLR